MQFNARVEDGYTIVSVKGRLDTVTAPECERKFRALLADNLRVVLDFDGLDYISSAGLKSLLVLAELVKEKNGRICLANLNENVRALFDISGCNRAIEAKSSLEEAIAAVS
jgi:stage II sporulation protein AA (anti-sigma F factor antagonist)